MLILVARKTQGVKAEQFTRVKKERRERVAELTAHLRADPNLTKEGAKALEALIKAAYQQFRKSQQLGKMALVAVSTARHRDGRAQSERGR